ncbi:hypothetical protein OOK41_31650 [Micromonospora sp. NBC_01655]|uniref:hypothetical protein n=1 Tax=Micromonospora sp. NBC_01655 TaxID=2975983 RepID=UPI00224D55CF|nr:hypothetical protein [Micromonospora sp. NBC_01655]MCX4474817.1 hypothetical protein [Micromonospora sp. NBC_01655]
MPILTGGQVMPGNGIPTSAFTKAGALAANNFAGQCVVGSLAIDTSAGVLYICTATNGTTTATWVTVGSQT